MPTISSISSPRIQLLGLLGLAAVLFFFNTWGYDLWPADEPRFGEISREMMQSGDYLAPQCNGEPYKEKPPLLFWAIVAASLPFGDVTEFSARMPSGLAALGTVLLTYLLARRLFGAKAGFWASLILMTMTFFWTEARSVRTDMLLTLWMTASLYAFVCWNESRKMGWLVVLYAAITLGLYTKGPAALVFPGLFILVFYWRRRADRRALHWLAGFAICIALTLVWFIPARMGLPATPHAPETSSVGREMFYQIIGRLFLGVSKAEPPWYYLYNIPAGMLPWTLFLPWTVLFVWKQRREGGAMRLLLAWTIPAFLFFSASVGKRHVYLLPIYPTLAIMTAQAGLALAESDHARWRRWMGIVWGMALILLGLAPLAILATEYRDRWSPMFLSFSICAFAFGVGTLWRTFTTEMRGLHRSMAGQFAVLALLAATFFFPALDAYKGASEFCHPIRELALRHEDFRLYSVAFSREEYVFYSRHFHKRVLMDEVTVVPPTPIDKHTERKFQDELLAAIHTAAEDAQFAFPDTHPDVGLRAIDIAVAELGVDPQYAKAFMDATRAAVRQFEQDFLQPGAAFAFVQQDDWEWILPFLQTPSGFLVVTQDSVGQRDMLLLANKNGAGLLNKQNPSLAASAAGR